MNGNRSKQGVFKSLAESLTAAHSFRPEDAYQQPSKTRFATDRDALNGDALTIADDLDKTLSRFHRNYR